MSQSAKPIIQSKIAKDFDTTPVQEKEAYPVLTKGLKRSISGDLGQETKKIMFSQGNSEQKYNYVADASMPVTSVQTTIISTSRNIGNDAIPEIPDEELLQMALAFEKEQEQLVEKI